MTAKSTGNSDKNSNPAPTPKKRGNPQNLKPFVKGQSGNPSGRPKNRQSITYWLNEFGNMTPAEAATKCLSFASQLKRNTDDIPIFGLIAMRALTTLMHDPVGGVFSQVLDRVDGKMPTTIKTWQDEVVELLKNGTVQPADVVAELGSDLATQLFIAAGIAITEDSEAQSDSEA